METNKETVPPPPGPAGSHTGARAKIAIAFVGSTTNMALAAAVSQILAGLTGNPAFPHPSPTLAELTASRNAFVAKMDAAAGGGRLATQQCRDARGALARLLRNLALNLQHASGGDRADLLSTGYPLQRAPQPGGVLSAPERLRLQRTGASGQLLVRCAAVRGARAYQWRFADGTAPAAWTPAEPTAHARYLLTGLTPGSQVVAQARVLGNRGWSDWCDAVSAIAS